jgi:uncharacterized protein YceK
MKALLPMFCAVLLIGCSQMPEKTSPSQGVSQTAQAYRIVSYTQPLSEIQPEFTITQPSTHAKHS